MSNRLKLSLTIGDNWILSYLAPDDEEQRLAEELEQRRHALLLSYAEAKKSGDVSSVKELLDGSEAERAAIAAEMERMIRSVIVGLQVVGDNRKEAVSEYLAEIERVGLLRGRSLASLFDSLFFRGTIPMGSEGLQ